MCIKGVCHTTKKKISTIISSKKRHHRQLTKNEVRFFFFFWYGDKYFKAIDSGRLEAKKSRWRPSKRTILNKFPLLIRLANENSSHIHVYLVNFFFFFYHNTGPWAISFGKASQDKAMQGKISSHQLCWNFQASDEM